ncbi:MAG TPA: Spy/CpxP family protein refolding chaperone [Micropepsaceae bacterium]|nr:Spy/CpxP family protein refolding chaperone [Micropepsaceae bacterium]
MKRILTTAALLLATDSAFAESPYQGMQSRTVKALSEQQVADLNAGRGMGMALAAELNGYPGPSHVLELADKLQLKPDQVADVRSLFESMKRESIPLGAMLIEEERELDRQFASRAVTPESLRATTAAIARTQGELRETHLKYHLSTAALLDPEQMRRYARLRGYAGPSAHHHHQ